MKLVLIDWEDSFGCSPVWEKLSNCDPKRLMCRSVGWLLYDGEDCKTVVPHVTQEPDSAVRQGCGDMTIPTCAIVHMVELDSVGKELGDGPTTT